VRTLTISWFFVLNPSDYTEVSRARPAEGRCDLTASREILLFRRIAALAIDRVVVLLAGTFPLWFVELGARLLPRVPVFPLFPPFLLPFFLSFAAFYVLALEGLWDGRTLGKALVGIRVTRVQGHGIGLRESVLRNVMRLIDGIPFGLYVLGAAVAAHGGRRVGDVLAGTVVVKGRSALCTGWRRVGCGFLLLCVLPNLLVPLLMFDIGGARKPALFLRGAVVRVPPRTGPELVAMLDSVQQAGLNAVRVHRTDEKTFAGLAEEVRKRGLTLVCGVGGGWSHRIAPETAGLFVARHDGLLERCYWCVGNEDYAPDLSVPRSHVQAVHEAVKRASSAPTIFANHMLIHAPDLVLLRARGYGPIEFTDTLGFNAYSPGLAFCWNDLVTMWCDETSAGGGARAGCVRLFTKLYRTCHKRLSKRMGVSTFGFPYLVWSYACYGKLTGKPVILTEFGGTDDVRQIEDQLAVIRKFSNDLQGAIFHSWRCVDRDGDGKVDNEQVYRALAKWGHAAHGALLKANPEWRPVFRP